MKLKYNEKGEEEWVIDPCKCGSTDTTKHHDDWLGGVSYISCETCNHWGPEGMGLTDAIYLWNKEGEARHERKSA